MSEKVYNVLFICTHNSARSVMAEGLLNALGRGKFKAYSAGSQPGPVVSPIALKTLIAMHVTADGYRSKGWLEFAARERLPSILCLRFATTLLAKSVRSGRVSR